MQDQTDVLPKHNTVVTQSEDTGKCLNQCNVASICRQEMALLYEGGGIKVS